MPKPLALLMLSHSSGIFLRFLKISDVMETTIKINKGGRFKKRAIRRQLLAAMCTPLEKTLIEINAKRACMTVLEFLRELGLKGRVKIKVKTLPKIVLELTGTLNHMAANINQLARKRNSGEELNALERATLNKAVRDLQGLVTDIKTYVQ